jgi:hypothetical protein
MFCPNCGRKTVIHVLRHGAEDGWYCTRAACDFDAYSVNEDSAGDRYNEAPLRRAQEVCVRVDDPPDYWTYAREVMARSENAQPRRRR